MTEKLCDAFSVCRKEYDKIIVVTDTVRLCTPQK